MDSPFTMSELCVRSSTALRPTHGPITRLVSRATSAKCSSRSSSSTCSTQGREFRGFGLHPTPDRDMTYMRGQHQL